MFVSISRKARVQNEKKNIEKNLAKRNSPKKHEISILLNLKIQNFFSRNQMVKIVKFFTFEKIKNPLFSRDLPLSLARSCSINYWIFWRDVFVLRLCFSQGMDIIETLNPASFTEYLKKYGNTICGRHPIGVLLQAREYDIDIFVIPLNTHSGSLRPTEKVYPQKK